MPYINCDSAELRRQSACFPSLTWYLDIPIHRPSKHESGISRLNRIPMHAFLFLVFCSILLEGFCMNSCRAPFPHHPPLLILRMLIWSFTLACPFSGRRANAVYTTQSLLSLVL
ncbi:hypothetical protein BDV11DRAFT_191046, partial [Aspergillus similis]